VNYQHVHLNLNLRITQEETQKLKKEIILQERLATLGKLAGGIAHEFNNPLDGVMRYTNLALDQLDENDTVVREYLMEVKQGLKRMANIVKSLLACARNEQPSSTKVDVNRSIENALKEQNINLMRKKIIVEKELNKNIPEIIDLGLDRILSNIISNAIDAMDNNGKIFIKSNIERGLLKLIIADNGKGIPMDLLKKIFDPFFTTKKIDQGCGLGLTIVHEIIKHYKGEIAVESAQNAGTTFTILLPLESPSNEHK
jgi:signal transduction histidine kinase